MLIKDTNLPKTVVANLPKLYNFFRMPVVQVKLGNKIISLLCDRKVFKQIEAKKNYKVELAGVYILSLVNQKKSKNKN
jgi:hypothetical protein